jgi:hypothetical protein
MMTEVVAKVTATATPPCISRTNTAACPSRRATPVQREFPDVQGIANLQRWYGRFSIAPSVREDPVPSTRRVLELRESSAGPQQLAAPRTKRSDVGTSSSRETCIVRGSRRGCPCDRLEWLQRRWSPELDSRYDPFDDVDSKSRERRRACRGRGMDASGPGSP